jgi:hypothetical protein
MSQQPPPSPSLHPVVDLVTVGAFQATLIGGIFAAIGSAILGGVAARATTQPGETAGSAGGILGTVLASVVLPVLYGAGKPWYRAALLVAAGGAGVWLLDWSIPAHFDWPVYRWALAGTACGVPLFGYFWTLEQVREDRIDVGRKAILFTGPPLLLAAGIGLISRGRAGAVLGGLLAGGCGGAASGLFVGLFAVAAVTEWAGSLLVIALAGAALDAVGGGLAGWSSWRIAAG